VELPLDWLRELHEPHLSFKPAINFITPWFGLAPKPSQYFSRFGLGSEDFRCLANDSDVLLRQSVLVMLLK
jgi:hypothetical protein